MNFLSRLKASFQIEKKITYDETQQDNIIKIIRLSNINIDVDLQLVPFC